MALPAILAHFRYEHLPPQLQAVSRPFCDLARAIVGDRSTLLAASEGAEVLPSGDVRSGAFPLPDDPERDAALRKLLEAKDAAVRARLAGVL